MTIYQTYTAHELRWLVKSDAAYELKLELHKLKLELHKLKLELHFKVIHSVIGVQTLVCA